MSGSKPWTRLTVDVENADEGLCVWVLPDGGVDLGHQPVKNAAVQRFGQGIPVVCAGPHIQGADDGACTATFSFRHHVAGFGELWPDMPSVGHVPVPLADSWPEANSSSINCKA